MTFYERNGDDIDKDLVGYWKMDDLKVSSNTIAIDRANFNDGTINGCTSTTDINNKKGEAIFFDGVDDIIDCGNGTSFDIKDVVTLSAWVYYEPVQSETYIMIGGKWLTGTSNRCYSLMINSNDDDMGFWISKNGLIYKVAEDTSMDFNTWTHYVGVYDGRYLTLYKNGVLVGTDHFTVAESINSEPTDNFVLGARDVPDRHFHGAIKDFRIYNRILNQAEISKLYRLRK